MSEPISSHVSRRTFFKTAAVATAAPLILPSGVLAKPGRPGANDRLVSGHIGLGGMGRGHLNGTDAKNIAAVCDVDSAHLTSAASDVIQRGGRNLLVCKDFRYVLERKDIDAVIIATPDHWHAVMTIHACEAGKDVYCEKPACRTIEEGEAMIGTVRKTRRVVQIGSQGRSTAAGRQAALYLRNGMIGRVTHVECLHYPSPIGGKAAFCDPPLELDWDMWLGPHRWAPYNPDCVHFNFRWMFDFGGGQIRDRGAHIMSVVLFAMDQDDYQLESVEASGEVPPGGLWDSPREMNVTYQFRNPDWTMTWSQTGEKVLGHEFGARYHGERGTIEVGGGDGGTFVTGEVMEYKPPAGGVQLPEIKDHRSNWIDCVRTRQLPNMHIGAGAAVARLCNLGNLSFRLKRKLLWDAGRCRCIHDDEANRLLGEPQRGPWHLSI